MSPSFKFLAVFCLASILSEEASAVSDAARNLAGTCANCHGIDGKAKPGMPSIAGKKPAEVAALLFAFRAGQRPSTIMHQISKGYTDDQILLIAEYFAPQVKGTKN